MSYRVQFTVIDAEYQKLIEQADKEGFPNIAEMCKMRALNGNDELRGKNDYSKLYKLMVEKIAAKEPGDEFYLRDLIDTPPALLGRWLFDNVQNGKIPDVVHLGNDGTNPERYKKGQPNESLN